MTLRVLLAFSDLDDEDAWLDALDPLQISAHTAKFHVQGLLDKLDATTRTEAAVRAARLWLI